MQEFNGVNTAKPFHKLDAILDLHWKSIASRNNPLSYIKSDTKSYCVLYM